MSNAKIRIAREICTFLGVNSKQQGGKAAKLLEEELSNMLSGLARGEKKKILKSFSNMANGKGNFDGQIDDIRKVAAKAKNRTSHLVEIGYEDQIKKGAPEYLERMKKYQREDAVFDEILGTNASQKELTLVDAENELRQLYATQMPQKYAQQGGIDVPYESITTPMRTHKIVTDLKKKFIIKCNYKFTINSF